MIMFGIKIGTSHTPYRGYYDHTLGKVVFYVNFDIQTLLASRVTQLQVIGASVRTNDFNNTGTELMKTVCVNAGVTWNQFNFQTCMAKS